MSRVMDIVHIIVNKTKLLVLLLGLICLSAVFCADTHADDSITITIDKSAVDLNVSPRSDAGTFVKSGNSTVLVSTTNSAGYTLGIRADGANPTKLINSSDSSTSTNSLTSITAATTEEQFKALAGTSYNGMWGYLPSKLNSAANTSFLPAPTATGDVLDETSTANSTANTYTLAIGARVDSAQKVGTYSNTYVVYASANAISYSIVYDDNVVTNMPADVNSGQAVGGQLNIASNTPVRAGYKFLGWCTVQPTNNNGTDTCSGTQYSANQSVTISAATAFHLYAMWEKVNYIQNWSGCSGMSVGDTVSLTDARDDEVYLVGKLADNKCWMLDNLRLDPANATTLANITDFTTNASATSINYFKNGGGTTNDRYPIAKINNTAWTSDSQNYHSIPMTVSSGNSWTKDTTTTSYGAGSGKIGVYYNYCAASAGSYCYGDDTSAGTSSGDATEDLCPIGWRMPTGGSSGEYQALYSAYSNNVSDFQTALSTPLSGFFYSGLTYAQGALGYWWSSTWNSNYSMYILGANASGVSPASNNGRIYGYSLRCIARQ